jgi:hypothetical protein
MKIFWHHVEVEVGTKCQIGEQLNIRLDDGESLGIKENYWCK